MKIVLFGQGVFCFPDQLQLFPDEVAIIDDSSAFGANEMVMMILLISASQLVAALAVPGGGFLDESQPVQQFQRPINRRQADAGIKRI